MKSRSNTNCVGKKKVVSRTTLNHSRLNEISSLLASGVRRRRSCSDSGRSRSESRGSRPRLQTFETSFGQHSVCATSGINFWLHNFGFDTSEDERFCKFGEFWQHLRCENASFATEIQFSRSDSPRPRRNWMGWTQWRGCRSTSTECLRRRRLQLRRNPRTTFLTPVLS